MAKIKVQRVKFHPKGFAKLLNAAGVAADLDRRAAAIAAAANSGASGFETRGETGGNRARAAVVTTSVDAMLAERDELALTRAIDAGRR